LLALDRIPADSWFKNYLIAMIPISGLFYVGLARNTHTILSEPNPQFSATRSEKKNVLIAFVALAIMLFFAYHIERSSAPAKVTSPSSPSAGQPIH
jgi:hypothetical protein